MAFDTGNGSNNGNNNNTREEQWKATGFINIFLPSREGGRVKLGAIPLKSAKPREKELADWLAGKDIPANTPEADKEDVLHARMGKLIGKLELEYASAEPSDAKGFDLT